MACQPAPQPKRTQRRPFGLGIGAEPLLALPARGAPGEPVNVSLERLREARTGFPNLCYGRYGVGRASSAVFRFALGFGLGVAFGFVLGLSVLMAAASSVLLMWAA